MRGFFALLALSHSVSAGEPNLFQAIRDGDLAQLRQSVNASILNARDRRGATLLMHAAAFGNFETLKFLIDRGADVNAENDFAATALLWAARDPEKARLLIEHGADVKARSKQGRTPLMLASLLRGGSPTVTLMLSRGADPNVKDNHDDTALGLAASIGEVATMRLLLAKGADPHSRNDRGESPLILASKSRNRRRASTPGPARRGQRGEHLLGFGAQRTHRHDQIDGSAPRRGLRSHRNGA